MKIKICGLRRDVDVDIINRCSPDYAGFIIEYPKSKRSLPLDRAIYLSSLLKKNTKSVGVFVDAPLDTIIKASMHFDLIQLHGNESDDYIKALSSRITKTIIKAFVIREESDIEMANNSSSTLLLLDGGKGDGKTFDWNLLKRINKPFFLAGGINEENIRNAIENIKPMAIDISSGVETDGIKDEKKIKRIMEIINEYRQ